jgi:hypothetical protein
MLVASARRLMAGATVTVVFPLFPRRAVSRHSLWSGLIRVP